MRASREQIIRNIAVILKHNPQKVAQLEKVGDITVHLTSDDSAWCEVELYYNNIVRYLITGTRSSCTITADLKTMQVIRKPRNAKPWANACVDLQVFDIIRRYNDITEEDAK